MIVKKIGYILMLVGLALPIFLMTNMVVRQLKEHARYTAYQQDKHALTADQQEAIASYQSTITHEETVTIDPFAEISKKEDAVDLSGFEDGVIGYLSVPSIDIKQPIRVGASEENLDLGVATINGTSLPIGGIGNRSVIAGHRNWYNDIRFLRLNELKAGDEIYVELGDRTLTYVVQNIEIIEASEWQKLTPVKDQDMLTLLTCDPLVPPFNYRLLVNATRQVAGITKEEKVKQQRALEKGIRSTPYDTLFWGTVAAWIIFAFLLYRFYRLLGSFRREAQVFKDSRKTA